MKHTFQSHGLRYFILTETISSEQIRRRKKKKKERKKEGEEKKKKRKKKKKKGKKKKKKKEKILQMRISLRFLLCSFHFVHFNLIPKT